ncbi:S-layer homology domain-containing protein [Falsibacillus pallidus]|uniref:S-layer homology domain-containing protein n=1 Tax=Falsibacillus pallidus TaxID=493781 RepID=UPI003D9759ED
MYKEKSYKKFMAASVTSVMVASSLTPVFAAEQTSTFSDVKAGMDGYKEITYLTDNGVINGYKDGTYKPSQSISRGQVAKILARALELEVPKDRSDYLFPDVSVNNKDQELVDAIAAVSNAGIFSGKTDGKFHPEQMMTRQQMAKVLTIAFDLDLYGGKNQVEFKDENKVSKDLDEYVAAIAELGITIGHDGEFMPLSNTSRKQFAQFVYRAFFFESNPTVDGVELVGADDNSLQLDADQLNGLHITGEELNKLDTITFYTNGIADKIDLAVETKIGSVLVRETATGEGQNYIDLDVKALREKHGGTLPNGAYYFNIKTTNTVGDTLEYAATMEAVQPTKPEFKAMSVNGAVTDNEAFMKTTYNEEQFKQLKNMNFALTEKADTAVVTVKNGDFEKTFTTKDTDSIDVDFAKLREENPTLPAGKYTVELMYTNNVGEKNAFTTDFSVDGAPTVTGVENNKVYNADVTPDSDADDIVSSELVYNGAKQSVYDLGEKLHRDGQYELTLTDKAGNKTTTAFTIDKTAPTVDVTGLDQTEFHYGDDLTFSVAASDSNFDKLSVTVDGNEIDAAKPFTIATDGSKDGKHTLVYSALDKAGNKTENTIDFNVDSTLANVDTAQELTAAVAADKVAKVNLTGDVAINNTLTIDHPVMLDGQDHTLKVTSTGYGVLLDNTKGITVSNLKVDASATGLYGMKIQQVEDLTIDNVSVSGAGRSNIDLNGVKNAALSNITVKNAVKGVGFAATASTGVKVNGITTSNNAWGGVGLYTGSETAFAGDNTFSETTAGVYTDDKGHAAVTGFAYKVTSTDAGYGTYAFYFATKEAADAFAAKFTNKLVEKM